MEEFPDIKQKGIDYFTSLSKGTLGLVPFAGSFLGEIIGVIIPNQRIDRVCKYLEILNHKIELLANKDTKDDIINNTDLMLLFEKSIRYASETNSEDKYNYYAEFIVESIENKSTNEFQKERLLALLSELNEIEIILLIYHGLELTLASKNDFFEKNKNIIHPYLAVLSDPIEKRYDESFNKQYFQHLERLGLIMGEMEVDRERNTPIIDTFSGQLKIRCYKLTLVGHLLNKFIGGEKFK